jgi:hypothetical protein
MIGVMRPAPTLAYSARILCLLFLFPLPPQAAAASHTNRAIGHVDRSTPGRTLQQTPPRVSVTASTVNGADGKLS